MSGDRYYIQDQHGIHFLTFTVMEWVDVFTRKDYKYIIVDALNYCIKEKGLTCYAWVLMSNHLHLIVKTISPFRLSDVIRDFKKFTSKEIIKTIQTITESRSDWLLHRFEYAAKITGRAENFKVWQDSNHAVYVDADHHRFMQRLNYIHLNPVRQLIVANPEEYLFSNAGDYHGKKGMVNITIAY